MKRIMLALLLITALLTGCISFAETAEDPVVIRVGDFTYSKSMAEFAMRAASDENGLLWETLDQGKKEQIRDTVLLQLISMGVIECKLAEQGKHDFSAQEETILRTKAQSLYEQMWMELYQYLNGNGVTATEEEVTAWLNGMGYTQELFLENVKADERQYRAFDLYCTDVVLSDDEIMAYYDTTCVRPEQERYEHNIPLYEEEMLSQGKAAFFVPEGYKYLKLIKVNYPEQLLDEAQSLRIRMNLTDENTLSAYNALAMAAASVEKLEELQQYRDTYFEVKASYEEAVRAYMSKLSEVLPLADTVEEKVRTGLEAGQSIEQMITRYSDDDTYADPENPGIPFHADSGNWNGSMREAALRLNRIGDLSEPVQTLDGYYLLYYAGDMPGGRHELTEEEFAAVGSKALYDAKLQKLTDLIMEWVADYDVDVFPELLDMD